MLLGYPAERPLVLLVRKRKLISILQYAREVRQLANVYNYRQPNPEPPYPIPEHGGGGRGTPTAYRQ